MKTSQASRHAPADMAVTMENAWASCWNGRAMFIAVDAADDIGDHHDDGEPGQKLHDRVHIVGDDGGEGVHGPRKDVAVDVGHADGLAVFGDGVLQQVGLLLAELDAAHAQDLVHDDVVGLEGRGEVDETLLDAQEVDELLVACGELQTLLDDVGAAVDVLEAAQEHEGPCAA